MAEDGARGYRVAVEWRRDIVAPIMILLMLVGGAMAYPHLPARVPIHWNLAGEANRWSGPLFAVLFAPAMALAVWLLLLVLPAIDPRRENYAAFIGFYRTLRLGIVMIFAAVQALTLSAGLGRPEGRPDAVLLVVAALFVFIGNSLGRVRHNYFVGVRTPWTLANEEVWRRTHRFAGPLFVAAGLVGAVGLLLSAPWQLAPLLIGVAGVAVATVVYSYLAYRRVVG